MGGDKQNHYFVVMYVSKSGNGFAGVIPYLFKTEREAEEVVKEESENNESLDYYIEYVHCDYKTYESTELR